MVRKSSNLYILRKLPRILSNEKRIGISESKLRFPGPRESQPVCTLLVGMRFDLAAEIAAWSTRA